jgi:hypothetical protein
MTTNRAPIIFLTLFFLFAAAYRLPAPISEIPTPTPAQSRPKPKSASASKQKAPAENEAKITDQAVQVVLSPTTQATLTYLKNYVDKVAHAPFAMKTDVEPNEIAERLRQVLSSRFKSVSITNDSSGGSRAGLVMVFDLQAHVGVISTQKNTVSLVATFKNGNGKAIETITASGSSRVPYPNLRTHFPEALTAAFAQFSQKLGNRGQ